MRSDAKAHKNTLEFLVLVKMKVITGGGTINKVINPFLKI